LGKAGLVAGRDYVIRQRSAQNEMPMLASLFDAATTDGTDLFITFSTPTLQAAIRKIKHEPVVFTFVADPLAAGAGQSFTNHLPNFTGVSTLAPAAEMVQLLKTYFPQLKRLGTVYCPAEINSVKNLEYFTKEVQKGGLTLDAVPANSVSELPDAARALSAKDLDAIVQISDNLSAAGFAAIAQAAHAHRLPLIAFQSPAVNQGAALALSMDYHQAGLDGAAVAARVMRGDNPANIPFALTSRETLVINLTNAADQGLPIPEALRKKADKVSP
jgi:ABC-type uncharacterized transport system substrate-binding protein